MNNKASIILVISIVALIGLDALLFGGSNLLFLAKKFVALTEWVAFWR